ncbi:MAG: hypothetical protein NVSMB16_17330 [Acidimicrobiales bacterium]
MSSPPPGSATSSACGRPDTGRPVQPLGLVPTRSQLRAEVWLVLALSLGASGVDAAPDRL